MPSTCSVHNCTSGYTAHGTPPGVGFHRFPDDADLKKIWLYQISRKDFKPGVDARVCSLHFRPQDFRTASVDGNLSRRKRRLENGEDFLRKKILKPGVYPTIFADYHQHWNSDWKVGKKEILLGEEESDLNWNGPELQNRDKIGSLEDVEEFLNKDPDDASCFAVVKKNNKLLVCFCEMDELDTFPVVVASLAVGEKLDYSVSIRGRLIPSKYLPFQKDRFDHFSEITRTMATIQNWCTEDLPKGILVNSAVSSLKELSTALTAPEKKLKLVTIVDMLKTM